MSRPNADMFKFFLNRGVSTFVETGTFHGGGVSTAVRNGFEKVISIEVVKEFYEECTEKFSDKIDEGVVELVYGDSAVKFPIVCENIESPCVFWLDAHYQGEEAEFDANNCPLNPEISAIINRANENDVVLIDDLRLLQDPKAWRGHDVVIDTVIGSLMRAFPNSVGVFLDGYTPRDIFAVFPTKLAHEFFTQFNEGRVGTSE